MAQDIGVAKVVQGQMTASGPEGSRSLHQGDHVFKGDTLATAKGSAGSIEFLDKTVLNVGEGAKVSLDQYVYDASKGTGKVLFKLAQGTFRTVTGEIVKNNPESFKMQSPLATIGIRGTETAHTIPGPGEGEGKENHLVMVFDGKPVIVQPLGGGTFQVLSQAGVKVEVGKFGAGPVLIMTPQEFKYYNALTATGIQQGAPTDTISTGQGAGQSQVKDAQTAAATAQADAAAKAAAETAAKAAAEAAAQAAAEAAKAGDPAAKAAAEAAAKAAADAAAKAATEAKAAAELAAKAAAEAAAALQAQALVAAAKAAAELAAQQQQQQQGQQFQGSPLDLSQGTIFNINSLMGTTGSSGSGGPTGPTGPAGPTGPTTAPPDPGPIVSQIAQTIIDTVTTITPNNSISLADKSDGQFVDLAPTDQNPSEATLRDSAYYESSTNHMNWIEFSYSNAYEAGVTPVSASIANVYGSEFNDEIYGNSSANIIHGGGGADTIYGRAGADLIEGGAGQDDLHGDDGNDTIDGGEHNDTIYGDDGNDVLSGGLGNDVMNGGIGNDAINGGGDDDELNGDDGNDSMNGDSGNDTINGGLGNDILTAGTGNDNVQGGENDDTIYMDVNLTAADTINGGLGADILYYTDNGLGTDELTNVTGVETITLGAAASAITITNALAGTLVGGSNGNEKHITVDGSATTSLSFDASTVTTGYDYFYVTGGAGADLLKGGSIGDSLSGGDGNDTIDGGKGADTLYGGNGNDTFNASDGNDSIYGGAGNDIFDLSALTSGNPITINGGGDQAGSAVFSLLGANTQAFSGIEIIKGGGGADSITLTSWTSDATVYGNAGTDTIYGGSGNDSLDGGLDNDVLHGNAGNDTIYGGDGDDTINGGAGSNHLHGDVGNDMVSYGNATAAVTANLSTGSVTANGYGGADTLYDIERYYGSNHGDTVTAGSTTTVITLGSGNDSLNMGSNLTSTDTVTGGGGNDTLRFTDANGDSSAVKTDLNGVDGFEHIVLEGVNANVAPGNSLFNNVATISDPLYNWNAMSMIHTVSVDGSALTGSLSFDANGITQGYLYIRGSEQADLIVGSNSASGASATDYTNKIFGGGGADTLTGANSFADMFIYKAQAEGGDTITNFTSGSDKLAFYKTDAEGNFGYNNTSTLAGHVFGSVGAYAGSNTACWYVDSTDTSHIKLMYDDDGQTGAHAAQMIADTGTSAIATTDVVIVSASHLVV